jgi:hypothetical protein
LRITTRLIRGLGVLGLAAAVALFAGCGGGGGSSSGGSTSGGSASNGSGSGGSSSGGSSSGGSSSGGSSGGGSSGGSTTVTNAATVTISSGVANAPNIPTVSVTICVPGTSNCQTITNVQVDTESFGLRLASEAIPSQLLSSLPTSTVNGAQLAECSQFADSFTWGSVRTADVQVAGETASSLPIQVIGDLSSVPEGCSQGLPEQSTPSQLGANGILGIGVAPYDCGSACVTSTDTTPAYYGCSSSTSCSPTTVPLAQQVTNPVPRFATDNNGVILQLPSIPSTGQVSATGTLYFGIGTRSNNTLSPVVGTFSTSPYGDVAGTYNGVAVEEAFFDSGSNAYFFASGSDSAMVRCVVGTADGFYCPTSALTRSATVQNYGGAGSATTLSLSIENASSLFATGNFAFNDLAGPLSGVLDMGLPFFYGRTVYYGMDQTANGGQAPYVAF